ncbi:uncharacterized protein J3R85_007258 [Psidium guajava]|nr:uncharacterized protein J3R85_007258 [Psidium guajava]
MGHGYAGAPPYRSLHHNSKFKQNSTPNRTLKSTSAPRILSALR